MYGIHWDAPDGDENVESVSNTLSPLTRRHGTAVVNPLAQTDDYGISQYRRTVSFVLISVRIITKFQSCIDEFI